MTRHGTIAATVAATAMLAGCGGGGGGTGNSDPPETADPAKTLEQVFDDGETIRATHSTAARIDLTNGIVAPQQWDEFSVAWEDAARQPTLTLEGISHTFTDEELSEDWAWQWDSVDDHGMYLECWTCPDTTHLIALHAGRKAAVITDQVTNGFAIVGLPTTRFDNAPRRATYASITGSQGPFGAMLVFRAQEDYNSGDREIYYGDTALVADFTNQTLSGRLFNFEDEDGEPWSAFVMSMPETRFTSEGFSGHFDVSGLQSGVSALAYDGSLYGPEAQEVGGVISGTAVGQNGVSYLATGMFAGSR